MDRIRKLSSKDARRALPLLEAQYREHDIAMGGERLARALQVLVLPANGVLLYAQDGVAALTFQFSIERGGRIGWLEELYVSPARRGQGLGSLLLRRAAREAKKAGCLSLELEVVRGHERAARLYVREGFSKLPRLRYSLPLAKVTPGMDPGSILLHT